MGEILLFITRGIMLLHSENMAIMQILDNNNASDKYQKRMDTLMHECFNGSEVSDNTREGEK